MVVAVGAEGEAFTVYAQDRIQQRFVEQITLKFQFLTVVAVGEVFTAFAQDEFLLPQPRARLVPWMRILLGFSHSSPKEKKREVGSALRVRSAPGVEPIHAVPDEDEPGVRGGRPGQMGECIRPQVVEVRALPWEVVLAGTGLDVDTICEEPG